MERVFGTPSATIPSCSVACWSVSPWPRAFPTRLLRECGE